MNKEFLYRFRKLAGVVTEDPNSFFAPSPPITGRKKPATSTLMGGENPSEDKSLERKPKKRR